MNSQADNTMDQKLDQPRLAKQFELVKALVLGRGGWMTLREIADATGQPEASVSARLRQLRNPQFGAYRVNKRRRGMAARGLWEYQVVAPEPVQTELFAK